MWGDRSERYPVRASSRSPSTGRVPGHSRPHQAQWDLHASLGAWGMGVTKPQPRVLGPNPGVLTPAPPTAAQPWEGRGQAASVVTRTGEQASPGVGAGLLSPGALPM